MNIKFSIIIPAYNAEKYLTDCFESLFRQTYSNFEAIIIDDGSTDNTALICENWVKRDGRWRYFRQQNSGQLAARLHGISKSSGNYVMFLDSDDFLFLDSLEKLVKKIEKYDNPDMLIFKLLSLDNNNIYDFSNGFVTDRFFEGTQTIELLRETCLSDNFNSMCQKVIKVPFPDLSSQIDNGIFAMRMGEDALQSLFYLSKINSVVLIPDNIYVYRVNPYSVTNKKQIEKTKSHIFSVGKMLLEKHKFINLSNDRNEFIKYVSQYLKNYTLEIILVTKGSFEDRYSLYEYCSECLTAFGEYDSEKLYALYYHRQYKRIDAIAKQLRIKHYFRHKLRFLKPIIYKNKMIKR